MRKNTSETKFPSLSVCVCVDSCDIEHSLHFLNVPSFYFRLIYRCSESITGKCSDRLNELCQISSVILLTKKNHKKLPPPDWVNKDVMEKLKVLKDFSYQIMFGVYKSKEKCRLQGGERSSLGRASYFPVNFN